MGKWTFDPYHTQVEFSAKHLGMMTVRGRFNEVAVTGEVLPEQPERSHFEATIKVESLNTHNPQRDTDLKSSNFLELEKYPTITFKSTKIEPAGGEKYRVKGDLTIKGNTHPVTLDAVKYGEFNDERMGHRIGYAAQTEIKRRDYGLTFDMVLDGKLIVSNEIQINIEGELVETADQPAKETAQAKS